ncbi:MAG: serine hydrolase [Acidimicrobiales bacterium]
MPRRTFAVALAAVALIAAACGDDDSGSDTDENGASTVFEVAAPETPAGEALVWVIESFGTEPDDDALADRFHPRFVEDVGADELRAGLVSFAGPDRTLRSIRIDKPDEVLAAVVVGEQPLLVSVAVEADAPHRIVALSLAPAGGDDEVDLDLPETPAGEALGWVLSAVGTEPDEDELLDRFADDFLVELGVDELAQFLAGFRAEPPPAVRSIRVDEELALGVIARIGGADYSVQVLVEPEPPHRIVSLLLNPAPAELARPTSLDELVPVWAQAAEGSSLLLAEIANGECRPVEELSADIPGPVGSTFKLYVLGAVAAAVESGELTWDQPLAVRDELKSFPSGTFQDLDADTELTVQEFARAMIVASDNTATDHLIDLVGREAVEAAQADLGHADPALNRPFLTTREAFILKYGGVDEDELAAWLSGDEGTRRALLDEWSDRSLPPITAIDPSPTLIDQVEWFASPRDLCRAMVVLDELAQWPGLEPIDEILAAPDGAFDLPGRTVWYKGGSEPGVFNGTLLARADDMVVVISGTLVDPVAVSPDPGSLLEVLALGVTFATP